ncbi:hypothetical protein QJS10_CPB15g00699 [Acorus calamus]|uniref:RNA uridylyltransferase n=1 Tax=Acorus calamus TaxID=4465 RepID=A0AAV9D2L7_ACOCL|nr:hypothetical protein QJS10_CPB15g00699 [Acorus calamus]
MEFTRVGAGATPSSPSATPASDGEFLLQLIRQKPPTASSSGGSHALDIDPAIAALGPSHPFVLPIDPRFASPSPPWAHPVRPRPPPGFPPQPSRIEGFDVDGGGGGDGGVLRSHGPHTGRGRGRGAPGFEQQGFHRWNDRAEHESRLPGPSQRSNHVAGRWVAAEVGEPMISLNGQLERMDRARGSKESVMKSVVTLGRDEVVYEEQSYGKRLNHGMNGNVVSRTGAYHERDVYAAEIMDSLVIKDDIVGKKVVEPRNGSLGKDFGSDFFRRQQLPGQRMRNQKRRLECRPDIDSLTPSFLSIYNSLIPAEEEKAKQKRLILSLEKLVVKEWPDARLCLYGSCANSFGVSNCDIDVCLAIECDGTSKPEILTKLADILQSENLQNVQALTHARVPIVKLMDPSTGISCDICINNLLAVVNTKLLKDYAQIDGRLRQLAFIVKHWAKSRGVNETYRGTLSSYAYVLMCIHFLQQRRPAILPCLQEMEATYKVTVDEVECLYFDQVEKLKNFGAHNNESIGRLLWEFFDYWAYRHDYANAVISIRTGGFISKREKDWTRRIGNDRHLICIEDPFEVSHDLGRVVDKYSIKVLREEFERAADIMQYDPNPSVTL